MKRGAVWVSDNREGILPRLCRSNPYSILILGLGQSFGTFGYLMCSHFIPTLQTFQVTTIEVFAENHVTSAAGTGLKVDHGAHLFGCAFRTYGYTPLGIYNL